MPTAQNIKSEQIVETLRLRATALTPIHIGSYQQTLDKTEYLVSGGRVYVVDTDKLFSEGTALVTPQELDDWRRGNKRSLTDLYLERLKNRRPVTPPADMALYSLVENADMRGDQQYRPFERNGHGLAYIAGSSLKGAIRNGWLYHYLKTHPEKAQEVAQNLVRLITDMYQAAKNSGPSSREFGDLKKYLNDPIREDFFRAGFGANSDDVHNDLFRTISVSDSHPLTNAMLAADEVRVICDRLDSIFDTNGNLILYHKTTLVQECLQEKQKFEFRVSLNQKLKGMYQNQADAPANVEQLLDEVDSFFREVWTYDRDFYRPGNPDSTYRTMRDDAPTNLLSNFYETKLPPKGQGWLLRVGAGSGLHSVTPDVFFAPTESNQVLDDLRTQFENQLPDNEDASGSLVYWLGRLGFWQNQTKASIFPKSRKVVWRANRANNGGYVLPLGWLWLERV